MKIGFIQAKGGQGTTVVAAMTALALAETGPTLLVGNDDVFAVLGAMGDFVTDNLTCAKRDVGAIPAHFDHIVLDGQPSEERTYLVTRSCYLALLAAVRQAATYDGIVLIIEPGRALSAQDVRACLGKPIAAQLDWDPAIARAVDAGLLSSRVPASGKLAVKHLLRERV